MRLAEIIDRLRTMPVAQVIIVNNGSSVDFTGSPDFIRSIEASKNLGSAGGYKLGIIEALRSDCDYIWLLDDDNLPHEDALDKLFQQFRALKSDIEVEQLMLLSYRPRLFKHVYMTRSADSWSIGPLKNSFLGFHYRQLPRVLLRRLFGHSIPKVLKKRQENMPLGMGYYGGLFFHKSSISDGMLPDEHFFIYWDDMDFTRRFCRSGGRLYLVLESMIKDLDDEQAEKEREHFLYHPALDLSPSFKRFFYVRNLFSFENQGVKPTRLPYTINKTLMLFMLSSMALLRGNLSRMKLVFKAISVSKKYN